MSSTTFPSSSVTILETLTMISGTPTLVPYTTTIVSPTQGGSALGASSSSSGRKPSTAAIVGGVLGGVVGLLLLAALGAWCARNRRKGTRPSLRVTTQGPREITESSLGPWSPTMVESNFDSSQLAHEWRNSVGNTPPENPVPTGKRAVMERNTGAYYAPSSITSGYGPGSVAVPSTVSMSREALLPGHLPAESSGSYGITATGYAPHAAAKVSFSTTTREEDAGRLVSPEMRLPPEYRSVWIDNE
ncbi:hypothetical protein FOMPIDRAFT_93194 [Fomitopsis schrenkii]|uniref:Mid2 domain-containing protein n=1 Tax=Fomitopsis schrenkii TaxID=2126942 RepID=S8DLG1_FOMSC|nr:hypothetical protein FOMPIDRAFT_93194 [Fomitopsis schrenkii]